MDSECPLLPSPPGLHLDPSQVPVPGLEGDDPDLEKELPALEETDVMEAGPEDGQVLSACSNNVAGHERCPHVESLEKDARPSEEYAAAQVRLNSSYLQALETSEPAGVCTAHSKGPELSDVGECLEAGSIVIVHGLSSAVGQLLNGQYADVVALTGDAKRYRVRFANGEISALKPANLHLATNGDSTDEESEVDLGELKVRR